MRFDEVPKPVAIAARPHDGRGYPVLAITPWENGEPRFAITGTARILICAAERLCSICGTPMAPGSPVWRVVAGEEADAMAAARAAGTAYENAAATVEPPGHRACMLYAAVVCPWLARPNARRSNDAAAPGFEIARGEQRGYGGAVVSFDEYEAAVGEFVMFRFRGLREFRPHQLGAEHLDTLLAAVDEQDAEAGTPAIPECPPYLLTDESAAEARYAQHLRALRGI
ncbi:hypothetical protein [Catenulispora subtropica]|uniref:Uncharacterized protein n=1 Tax=Catenulispora subtropica TaxID=450798 RepID=A0ABP5C8D4_9ACTN